MSGSMLRSGLLVLSCLLSFFLSWKGQLTAPLALADAPFASPFFSKVPSSLGQSVRPPSPHLGRCPRLQKLSHLSETATLFWRIDAQHSIRPWAVVVDPSGQSASSRLVGAVIAPVPGTWIVSYGAKSCPHEATAIIDIPQTAVCPALEYFAYNPQADILQWVVNPQGNAGIFVDVISPAGRVASKDLQGSLFDPLPGMWLIEYGARSGCDVVGITTTEVTFTLTPEPLQ